MFNDFYSVNDFFLFLIIIYSANNDCVQLLPYIFLVQSIIYWPYRTAVMQHFKIYLLHFRLFVISGQQFHILSLIDFAFGILDK